ncbi:MAG: hypothetical protein DRN57_06690 [Thermoplasmata archaeon]|nr:MAG: hypothetical protein DRN57_06690 [Thermoplasmata archaeon]
MKGKIAILLAAAMLIITGLKVDGAEEGTHGVYSFDRDHDGIDDGFSGEGPFHVIIHASSSGDVPGIVRRITETGGEVQDTFTIVTAVTAVLPDMEDMKKLLDCKGVLVIERQIPPVPMMDTSVPAVKAAPSAEYSPKTAHDLGFTGKGVTIAIIDTGVDNEHPLLDGSFVAGADFTLPATPLTPRDGTFDPDDRSGHGTGVASIALGRDINGTVGTAPDAGLIDLKVVNSLNLDLNPFSNELLSALQWVSDHRDHDWGSGFNGIDVVSISLGIGPGDGAVARALDNLVGEGIPVVLAAGNSGGSYEDQTATSWPDRVIVAGGIDHKGTIDRSDDEPWPLSTTGPRTDDGDGDVYDELRPDVSAPCVSLHFALYSRTSGLQPASGMAQGSGTSFAAPHVSGTIACMLEANRNLRPNNRSNPLKTILHLTAEGMGDPSYPEISDTYNFQVGWGMLDAFSAVSEARSYSGSNHRPQIRSFTAQPERTTTGSIVTLKVTAIDPDEDPLSYELEVESGIYNGSGPTWQWTAPAEPGNYSFLVTVTDPSGSSDQQRTKVEVTEGAPNRPPLITSFDSEKSRLEIGESTRLTVVAVDQDGDELDYDYRAILGSISGSGEEVTYKAPDREGVDTVSVTVSDGKGGSDTRDLRITIVSDTGNSPPFILLLSIDPDVIDRNNTGTEIVLRCRVEDMDGLDDIENVVADLSTLGGSTGEEMKDDGISPDNVSGDGIYTLSVNLPGSLENGIYRIKVLVYDRAGASAEGSVDLKIDISPSGGVTTGTSSGGDVVRILVILAIILIFVILGSIFLVGMARRRRRKKLQIYTKHPTLSQVRYRPTAAPQQTIQAGPSSEGPKFSIVSGR